MCDVVEAKRTLTLKNFIPINREIMACVVAGDNSRLRNSFSSEAKRFRTEWKRDCARTPTTSAYRSAITIMLLAFGLFCTLKRVCKIKIHRFIAFYIG